MTRPPDAPGRPAARRGTVSPGGVSHGLPERPVGHAAAVGNESARHMGDAGIGGTPAESLVWPRIQRSLSPTARLLAVSAPPGFGRRALARAWAGRGGAVAVQEETLATGTHPRWDQLDGLFAGGPVGLVLATGRLADHADRLLDVLGRHPGLRIAVLAHDFGGDWDALRQQIELEWVAGPELLLRPAELAGHMLRHGHELSPDQVRRAWRLTGGVPLLAGPMALAGDPFGQDTLAQLRRRAESVVHTWLASVDRTGGIAASALLPTPTAPLLVECLGDAPRGQQILDGLLDAGVVLRDPDTDTHFMPELMRRAVVAELSANQPERLAALHDIVIMTLGDAGMLAEAIGYGVEREAWDGLLSTLAKHWVRLLSRHADLLPGVLGALPQGAVAKSPTIQLLVHAFSAYADDIPSMSQWALPAGARPAAIVVPPSATDAEAIEGHRARMVIARLRRDGATASDAARNLAPLLQRTLATDANRETLATDWLQTGLTLHLFGRFDEAEQCYLAAWQHAERAGTGWAMVNAAANLAALYAFEGRTAQGSEWLATAEAAMGGIEGDAPLFTRGIPLARALLALWRCDREGCAAAGLPGRVDRHELWPLHLYVLAEGQRRRGRADAALQMAGSLTAAPRPGDASLWARVHRRACASALLGQGYANRALEHLEAPGTADDALMLALAAQAHALRGEPAHALSLAERLLGTPGLPARVLQRARALTLALAGAPDERRYAAFVEDFLAERMLSDIGVLWDLPAWRDRLRPDLGLGTAEVEALEALAALRSPFAAAERPRLTPRELEVLRGLAAGHTPEQLAALAHLSPETVKTQRKALYRKLGVGRREDALDAGRRWGYL